MKFGCCMGYDDRESFAKKVKSLKASGFDYVELSLAQLMTLPDSGINGISEILTKADIPVLACNSFIPGDINLLGESADFDKIRRYLEKCFPLMNKLGVKKVVFGSGAARQVPAGMCKDSATVQLINFLRLANGYAEDYDVDIVIEPLSAHESNIVNSVLEGLWLCKLTDRPRVKMLCDYYHMLNDGQDAHEAVRCGASLRHTHIADKIGRKYPSRDTKELHRPFFEALKLMGYDDTISLEGAFDDFDNDTKEALLVMKELV